MIEDTKIVNPGVYNEIRDITEGGLPSNHQRLLIMAPRLSTGAVAELEAIRVYSSSDVAKACGAGSIAHLMAMSAFRCRKLIDLTVLGINDDAAGVANARTVTFTGPATSSGSFKFPIGLQKVQIKVNSGDVAGDVASAFKTACDNTPFLPFTAAVNSAVVTLTAKNKGTCANQIHIGYIQSDAAGVGVAIAQTVAGSNDPDLAAAFAAVLGDEFNYIVLPFNDADSLGLLQEHMVSVSDPEEGRPALGIYATTGAIADSKSLADGLNEKRTVTVYARYTDATRSAASAFEISSAAGAVAVSEENPSISLAGESLLGIPAPASADKLTSAECTELILAGVSPITSGGDNVMKIFRDVTSRTKDDGGIRDELYMNTTDIRIPDYIGRAYRALFTARKFPRTEAGKSSIKTQALSMLKKAADRGIIDEYEETTKPGLTVEFDGQDRAAVVIMTPIVRGGTILIYKNIIGILS